VITLALKKIRLEFRAASPTELDREMKNVFVYRVTHVFEPKETISSTHFMCGV
jgi:hypothetical protein